MRIVLSFLFLLSLTPMRSEAAAISDFNRFLPCLAVTSKSPLADVLTSLSSEQANQLYLKITSRVCARINYLTASGNDAAATELILGLIESN